MPDPHCKIGKVTLKTVMARENVYLLPGPVNRAVERYCAPVQAVIVMLEEILAEAHAGEIQACAVALVHPGQRTSHAWARGYGQNFHPLSTALTELDFAWRHDRFEVRQAQRGGE